MTEKMNSNLIIYFAASTTTAVLARLAMVVLPRLKANIKLNREISVK